MQGMVSGVAFISNIVNALKLGKFRDFRSFVNLFSGGLA